MLDIVLPEAILLILGVIYRFFPPKHINDLHGYRTKRSKQSKSAWEIAQKKCGEGFILAALFSFAIGVTLYMYDIPKSRLLNVIITVSMATFAFRRTEHFLRKNA